MMEQLRKLQDHEEIRQVIYQYCRALDRRDAELLAAVFHTDSSHEHAGYKGPSRDFCTFAIDFLHTIVATQHHAGNIIIELDGDVAFTETYWVAYHRIPASLTDGQGALVSHKPGVDEDLFIAGRYIDRFERRAGVWKIAHRTGVHDWQRWETADERKFRGPDMGPIGIQGRGDPVYSAGREPAPRT